MKKFLKLIAIITAIAAACAGAYLILKKLGFLKGCNLDCDNCDCDCACKDIKDEDDSDEEESFDSREYVSIQPKACKASEDEELTEEAEEAEDTDEAKAEDAE